MNWIKKKYNQWMLDYLVDYTGVRLDPDPGVWGLVSKEQEADTLKRIWDDELLIILIKKYAEQANKSTLAGLSQIELGKFLFANGLLLKAKRAFNDANKPTNKPRS